MFGSFGNFVWLRNRFQFPKKLWSNNWFQIGC